MKHIHIKIEQTLLDRGFNDDRLAQHIRYCLPGYMKDAVITIVRPVTTVGGFQKEGDDDGT